MKKKVLCTLLATTMVAGMFAGCGGGADASDAGASSGSETNAEAGATDAGADDAGTAASEEGKIFNIYCWNEEFKTRLTDHYPGYEVIDATTGKIGDVTVQWNVTPSDDGAYQNNLDATLLEQANAATDEKNRHVLN